MRVVTCLLTVGVLLTAAPLPAQTSIGFADPTDLDALLAYRLPDWGYRTWDGSLLLDGSGRNGDRTANDNRVDLGTVVKFYREGERNTWKVTGGALGSFRHRHTSDAANTVSQRDVGGVTYLFGDLDHYLGSSEVYVTVGANGRATYSEDSQTVAEEEEAAYRRTYDYGIRTGLGVGRVRDVTPLIRAQRLSERLAALGRAPLSSAQVVEVAQVLAQEFGYRLVFDRPDRRFWRDVLEPLLDPDRPLSVYEVHYLEEVLLESVGSRRQGQTVAVGVDLSEVRWSRDDLDLDIDTRREAVVAATWVRNVSLTQQFSVSGEVAYGWDHVSGADREIGRAGVRVDYLNNLSDRNRLDVSLAADARYFEIPDQYLARDLATILSIEDNFYLEDRVVLRPRVALDYRTGSNTDGAPVDPRISWQYGLSLDYYFDRLLY